MNACLCVRMRGCVRVCEVRECVSKCECVRAYTFTSPHISRGLVCVYERVCVHISLRAPAHVYASELECECACLYLY